MKRKSAIFALLILTSLLSMSAINSTVHVEGATAIANLVFKTNGGGTRPDYGLYIAQYLRDIGIEVDVKVEEWSVFVGTLVVTHDYDMGIVGLTGGGHSPDMRSVYTTNGSLNMLYSGIREASGTIVSIGALPLVCCENTYTTKNRTNCRFALRTEKKPRRTFMKRLNTPKNRSISLLVEGKRRLPTPASKLGKIFSVSSIQALIPNSSARSFSRANRRFTVRLSLV